MGIFSRKPDPHAQPSLDESTARFLQMSKEDADANRIANAATAWANRGNKPIVEYQVIEDKRLK